MKQSIKTIVATVLLLYVGVGCAQSKNSSKQTMKTTDRIAAEEQILELTREFTRYMIEKRIAEIDQIVDAQFTLTHITGYVQSKAEWFAEIEAESMKYYSYKEVSYSLNVDGDRATFVGRNLLDARIWGSRNRWRLQQTMQLESRKGKWIILNSVATTF